MGELLKLLKLQSEIKSDNDVILTALGKYKYEDKFFEDVKKLVQLKCQKK